MTEQGVSVSINESTRRRIEQARDMYPDAKSAVIPGLWAVQEALGYLPAEAMAEVAEILKLAPSEVQAVATFYSMYFTRPPGRHNVVACVNVACALRGADAIVKHLEQRLGCPSGATTSDQAITWNATIECLGACGAAPAMQIDHHFFENVTPEKLDAEIARLRLAPAPYGQTRASQETATNTQKRPASEKSDSESKYVVPKTGESTKTPESDTAVDGFKQAHVRPEDL